MEPKTQNFDFTKESNQEELQKWKEALKAIPLSLSIDRNLYNYETNKEIEVSYEFIGSEDEPDTWCWLGFLFKKGDLVNIVLQCNFTTGEENSLLDMVNAFLQKYGLPAIEDFDVAEIKDSTWQESYDLLCAIAKDTKIPSYSKK